MEAKTQKASGRAKRLAKKLFVVLPLLGVVVATVYALTGKSDAAAPAQRATSVAVQRGDLQLKVGATGAVEPEYSVEIKSKASGVVQKVLAQAGDRVEEGAPLVQIDPVIERRRVTQAQAELKIAQAQQTSVATKLRHARQQLSRDAALLKKGLVSRDVVDALRKEVAVLQGDAQIAAAQRLRAQSSYQEARERLAETKIDAPIAGTILDRSVQPGQVIASGTSSVSGGTTLMVVADLSRLFVRVKVDEADVARIRAGQQAAITADALPGRRFAGKVLRVAPQGITESNVTVFEVMIELGATARTALKPQMSANVEIEVGRADGVLLVPRSAIASSRRGSSVQVDGAGRREVTLGLADDRFVEVKSGLRLGERVVVASNAGRSAKGANGGTQKGSRGEGGQPSARRMQRLIGGGGR